MALASALATRIEFSPGSKAPSFVFRNQTTSTANGADSLWRTASQEEKTDDARLVAAMTVHGVRHVLTFNGEDFSRYPGITVLDPVKA